jgi:L-threonine kinase
MSNQTMTVGQRPSIRHNARGTGQAFGTFGELLQGVLPDPDRGFLVTMPISRGSTAVFQLDCATTEVRVLPASKQKSLRLVRAMLDHYGVEAGGCLTIDSDLPAGKGMASSSADLVATARAVSDALAVPATPATIEDFLRQIEPTDGVMYPGVVAFHHQEVRLRAYLGQLPAMTIVGIDEGGEVDTIAFNQIPKPFSARDQREYARLLGIVADAILFEDVVAIGYVATRSALMNQRLWPKRTLEQMIAICADVGGVGVVNAHSGTALGLLLADDDPNYPQRLGSAVRACSALAETVWTDHSLRRDDSRADLAASGFQPARKGLSCATRM